MRKKLTATLTLIGSLFATSSLSNALNTTNPKSGIEAILVPESQGSNGPLPNWDTIPDTKPTDSIAIDIINHYNLGIAYFDKEAYQKSIEEFNQGLSLLNSPNISSNLDVLFYQGLFRAYYFSQQWNETIDIGKKILESKNEKLKIKMQLYEELLTAYYHLNQNEEVINTFETIKKLFPKEYRHIKSSSFYVRVGIAYFNIGEAQYNINMCFEALNSFQYAKRMFNVAHRLSTNPIPKERNFDQSLSQKEIRGLIGTCNDAINTITPYCK